MDRIRVAIGLSVAALLVFVSMQIGKAQNPTTVGHKAVGSWFGKAVQVCDPGVSASVCVATGRPAEVLLMTPTLTSDGLFIADDSLTLQLNHLTAHGQWRATSPTEFIADYMFVLPTIPGTPAGSLAGLRARWQGRVFDDNTLVGHVNAIFTAGIPMVWSRLADNEFPAIAPQMEPMLTAPTSFTLVNQRCGTPGLPGCPLVFKFTIKRITPGA
jgi:hypothetical protein